MPGVARDGDSTTTGHGCDGSTTVTGPTGNSAKVYADGIAVECKGDPTASHRYGGTGCSLSHVTSIGAGSETVFVGGKAIARIGDSVESGAITGGSSTVFAG